MIKVTVQKNLIGLEDLLVGTGTVSQTRGPTGTSPVTITEINGANFPYDDTYSMSEKFDALQTQIDTLPEVVDEGGNLLTGLINSSTLDLDLENRLWRKTIDANTAEIYYYNELILQYDPTAGNILIPGGTDYIAADAVVTAAYEADDAAIQAQIDAFGDVVAYDVGTSANNIVQLNGSAQLPAVDGSLLTGLSSGDTIPVSTVVALASSSVPSGWLECDGSAVSRTTYADLFAAISTDYGVGDGTTTFNLPDLRGEFIRGWDNGKGTDSGRAIASFQDDALESHLHAAGTLATSSAGAHTHSITMGADAASGSVVDGGFSTGGGTASTNSAGAHTHTISGSTGSTGSTETRPRNIAMMYVIKH